MATGYFGVELVYFDVLSSYSGSTSSQIIKRENEKPKKERKVHETEKKNNAEWD
jgi:hypothetical protein